MWQVIESRAARKTLDRAPFSVRRNWDAWLLIVQHQGPDALRGIKGLHDEALAGKWKGYRSSRLTLQYRVIYSVHREQVRVDVEDVNKHDYR